MAVARYSPLALLAFLVSPIMVMATEYDITWETGADYAALLSQATFYVGYTIRFTYDTSKYDLVVGADTYAFNTCQMTPNLGRYENGDNTFTLDQHDTTIISCARITAPLRAWLGLYVQVEESRNKQIDVCEV